VNTPLSIAPRSGFLISLTHPSGRSLRFTYNVAGQLLTMTDPAHQVTRYGYDANNNLTSVIYPDNTTRTYLYNESTYTSGANLPHALTGIIDENNVRYATFQYDTTGRAMATEHNGGVEKYQVAYTGSPITKASVTDPIGTLRNYQFSRIAGVQRQTGTSQPGGSGCSAAASAITYDTYGNVTRQTDFNGNSTCYSYDSSRNLETIRLEGLAPGKSCPSNLAAYTPANDTAERKISTAWHPTWRLPTQIAEPNRMTTYTYDADGSLCGTTGVACNKTEQATLDNTGAQGLTAVADTTVSPRTSTWTYNRQGQVLTENGPRTDVNDTTTYAYDAQGNLASIRNAAGHLSYYSDYDPHGRPGRITDLNGHSTTLTYDLRGRLQVKTDDGNATVYTYDAVGNLTRLDLANGAYYTYRYDNAHRLTDLIDAAGNHLHYTLDAAGHRRQEDVYDANGQLTQTHRRVFDALSRLAQDIGAYNQTTQYQYDANGNLTRRTDPANHATAYAYDARNRRIAEADALTGNTSYRYDALDRLVSVTDPAGLVTAYQYDGLGNRLREDSPNTGTTLYGYDAAGNLTRRLDANAIQTLYRYDALNRLRQTDLPGTADDISYTYDYWSPTNAGIGRLYKVANSTATLKLGYDLSGRITAESLTLPGSYSPLASLSYRYDAAGWPSGITYPSGNRFDLVRTTTGDISTVNLSQNGQTIPLANTLQYVPFGPLQSLSYGNGLALNRSYDLDGRLQQHTLSGLQNLAHSYDPAGNLTGLTDSLVPANSQGFGYDPLDRLTSASSDYGSLGYTYDPDGNRLSETRNSVTANYAYPLNNQRLQSAGATNYGYDANGNTVQAGIASYVYNPLNQLKQANLGSSPIAQYGYDGLRQRVSKTVGSQTTYFLYGPNQALLAELDSTGTAQTEHLWLEGKPFAVIRNGQLGYVHPDRLGTPRLITDTSATPIWRWDSDPFGTTAANQDPDGNGVAFVYNLRFPGQYYDAETGLNYNLNRVYDAATGRYRESDPVGLWGGVNTYGYVSNNPISYSDRSGLCPICAAALYYALVYAEEITVASVITIEAASGVPNTVSSAVFEGRAVGEAVYDVYLGIRNGNPVYAGISRNITSRACQHGDRFDRLVQLTQSPITRDQARAIEQTLINENPHFENAINSINPNRSWYDEAVNWGTQWLRQHGF
jgi:RHS repeat-associated protein